MNREAHGRPNLELRQVDLCIVGFSLNFLRDNLTADDLAAFLIKREGRLTVELPAVVERVRHAMTENCIVLAREIAVGLHRPGLRNCCVPGRWLNVACVRGGYVPRAAADLVNAYFTNPSSN